MLTWDSPVPQIFVDSMIYFGKTYQKFLSKSEEERINILEKFGERTITSFERASTFDGLRTWTMKEMYDTYPEEFRAFFTLTEDTELIDFAIASNKDELVLQIAWNEWLTEKQQLDILSLDVPEAHCRLLDCRPISQAVFEVAKNKQNDLFLLCMVYNTSLTEDMANELAKSPYESVKNELIRLNKISSKIKA